MDANYVAPEFRSEAFHCPYCGTYAHQEWGPAFYQNTAMNPRVLVSVCTYCREMALWVEEAMVYPPRLFAAPAPEDLPDQPRATYEEARAIAGASPRAAAALLRLCLEQLVRFLGAESNNLNEAVGELVRQGLPIRIQQAMDALRLIGNNALHPGEVSMQDDFTNATLLFELVNLVVDSMITQPRMIDAVYKKLPSTKLEAINDRDKPPGPKTP